MQTVTFWVKSYDDFNRLVEHQYPERDPAYAEFQERISGGHYFVQMGVAGSDGSIVLNEWRKAEIVG